MRRTLITAGVTTAAAMSLMFVATAANATTIATVKNPTTGCTTTYYGPDIAIKTLPTPGVTTKGGVGESVSCP